MKAGLLHLAVLAATASAQVHRDHHGHAHHHFHEKRDAEQAPHKRDDVVVKTAVVYDTAPAAIVYVDQNGEPIGTSWPGQPHDTWATSTTSSSHKPKKTSSHSTSTPVAPVSSSATSTSTPVYSPPVYPVSSSTSSSAPVYPVTTSTSTSAPVYPVSSSTSTSHAPPAYSSAAATTGSGGSSGSSPYGISYSPYIVGGCKDASTVKSDFEKISGYGIVRLYGTDCDQLTNVIPVAKSKGMKVFAGVYDINSVESEVQIIIDAAKDDWSIIDTVSVGNELVNAGSATVAEVVAAITQVKSLLTAAGYTGHVVTVDTFVALIANPALCEASDYAAANAHAFFDGGVAADGAGAFVAKQAANVKSACGGKKTVITETGWPWQGESNGAAVPSRSNQEAALSSIKSSMSDNVFLFTAFDDTWKTDSAGTFGCEKYWGFIQ